MEKLDPIRHGQSPDIVAENLEELKRLFPDAFSEDKVDFDALRSVLGDRIEDHNERYGLNWMGKSVARRIAQNPSSGTLRPIPEDSVDWDSTQNLFIEGDNLEVLKLLQKGYHRKVKMIYIDPPYNTGKEFIYPDRFQDNLDTYLRYTGQVDGEGLKITANAETRGRFHTNWLNMMYPRLKLARNLLKDDGVIFVTIDDHEVQNLRHLMDEILGPENFVAMLTWRGKVSPANDATWFSIDHDYIAVYARNKEIWRPNRLPRTEAQKEYYTNPDDDKRGSWNSATYTCNKTSEQRPNLYYGIVNPNTNEEVWPSETAVWRFSKDKTDELLQDDRLYWGADGASVKPRLKKFLSEAGGVVPRSVWDYSDVGSTQEATTHLQKLLPNCGFDTAKPVRLVQQMLRIGTSTDDSDIVLDFFAGSGSTGEAVMQLNAEDTGNRRFVLVQLPETTDVPGFPNIAKITTARLRAAASAISSNTNDATSERIDTATADFGFRAYRLDSTNIKPWDGDFDNLEPNLLDSVENTKHDRSEEDVLHELLLKYGLDLTIPIQERIIDDKRVFVLGSGALVVCLAPDVTLNVVEGIGALKAELAPEVMRIVFRDASFKDDVVKTNAVQILKRAGIEDIKSL